MDNIASMNALRDDAATASRIGKKASARRSDDRDQTTSAFEGLLAGLVAPQAVPQVTQTQQAQPAPDQDASHMNVAETAQAKGANQTPSASEQAANIQTASEQALTQTALTAAENGDTTTAAKTDVQPHQAATETSTASAQTAALNETTDLLAQLAALGVDDAAPTSATPASVTTNAATLSASRSNAGAVAFAESESAQSLSADAANVTPDQSSTPTPPISNDNIAMGPSNKPKPTETGGTVKAPAQALEPVSMTTDGAGSNSVMSGQEVATPANDQANRAPQLTPHTIPMLAATMMRRLESGSKQFTMRLDPPELGQVEVKLTVAADKKVRAVISADRPEALADLVRSARELTRALHDAGLDLDDNGLTFQMNDPSGGNKQDARDSQMARPTTAKSSQTPSVESDVHAPAQPTSTSNDPFQRWQRARIALTV
jgi:flagellar hook-length control protein FliK